MIKKLVIATFAIVSLAHAMEEVKTAVLSKENTWLVHTTSLFPKDGVIIAGGLFRQLGSFTLEELYEQAEGTITVWRNSVHWSVNSLVYPHRTLECEVEREGCRYVILEPLKAFQGKKLRGYWQDVFHLGGHRLSKDAIILVPKSDVDYKKYVGEFKGSIKQYSETPRKASESVLKEHGAPVLYPGGSTLYHYNGAKQAIKINSSRYSSNDIAQLLELDNLVIADSCLGGMQKLFNDSIKHARGILACFATACQKVNSFSIKTFDECAECSVLSNNAKKLSACSACNITRYCSKGCQENHWKTHKKECGILKQCYKYGQGQIKLYADQAAKFPLLCNDKVRTRLQVLIDYLDSFYKKVLESYPDKKERELLEKYREYMSTFLKYLYAQEFPYKDMRAKYNLNSIKGFTSFVLAVQKILSPITKKIEGA